MKPFDPISEFSQEFAMAVPGPAVLTMRFVLLRVIKNPTAREIVSFGSLEWTIQRDTVDGCFEFLEALRDWVEIHRQGKPK